MKCLLQETNEQVFETSIKLSPASLLVFVKKLANQIFQFKYL